MNTEPHVITVSGIRVQIVRKVIKNLHLGVYPPEGRVRVAAPMAVSDDAVRLAVVGKLGWIRRQRTKFQTQLRQSYVINNDNKTAARRSQGRSNL